MVAKAVSGARLGETEIMRLFEARDADYQHVITAADHLRRSVAGNVVRYGVGLNYTAYKNCNWRIVPVAELVGWTVLSGKEMDFFGGEKNAAGDTLVNGKLGVRLWSSDTSSFYVGYGRALTGDVWYKDILRVEYRLWF